MTKNINIIKKNPQFLAGNLHHLLTTEYLPKETISNILAKAHSQQNKKFENKIILRQNGAKFYSFDNTEIDPTKADIIITKSESSGYPYHLSKNTSAHIINDGDGKHSSPLLALCVLATIVAKIGDDLSKSKIAIIGDITSSGLAKSMIFLLNTFGAERINLICPYSSLPTDFIDLPRVYHHINKEAGQRDTDIILSFIEPAGYHYAKKDCMILDNKQLENQENKEKILLALMDILITGEQ